MLHDLLLRAGRLESWRQIDRTISVMVGPPDSMNFEQLGALIQSVGITSPVQITSLAQLQQLQADIEAGTLGTQAIQGHGFFGSAGNGQVKLPRSFTFLGQRFTVDAWTFHNVTFDRIEEPGSNPVKLVRRRLPYSLDTAFAVFGNDQVVPDLVANILNPSGVPFRDGFAYQRNLAAVRNVLDQQPASVWESNLYNHWLFALRALSEPTTGPEYPEAMRTRAWAMKTLNTQLASWTQLRHDTVLYVKASETGPFLCSYPYGFVEPRPLFFQRMKAMAELARDELEKLPTAAAMAGKTRPFLTRFATNCVIMGAIAQKELLQQSLASSETNFLANVVEEFVTYFGGLHLSGWYPGMFYRSNEGVWPLPIPQPGNTVVPPTHDSMLEDHIVVDVHTDGFYPPDGDPGAVLHEGVGPVNVLVFAMDNGPDRIVYAGPVMSHYEFLQPYGSRLDDEQWKAKVYSGTAPAPPPWTQSYLVRKPTP